jgi:hypothetical protein
VSRRKAAKVRSSAMRFLGGVVGGSMVRVMRLTARMAPPKAEGRGEVVIADTVGEIARGRGGVRTWATVVVALSPCWRSGSRWTSETHETWRPGSVPSLRLSTTRRPLPAAGSVGSNAAGAALAACSCAPKKRRSRKRKVHKNSMETPSHLHRFYLSSWRA